MTDYALTKTMVGCSLGEGDELSTLMDEQLESGFITVDNADVIPGEDVLPGYANAVLVGGADGAGGLGTAGLYSRG